MALAAYQLTAGVPAAAQVWHCAVGLVDRAVGLRHETAQDGVMAAACVLLAAAKEGVALEPGALAQRMDAEVGGQGPVWRRRLVEGQLLRAGERAGG